MRFLQFPRLASLLICFSVLLAVSSCQPTSDHGSESGTAGTDSTSAPLPVEQGAAFLNIHIPDSLPSDDIKVDLVAGSTVLLGKTMMGMTDLQLEAKEYKGMGHLITAMKGFRNNENGERYWQFCLNGVISDKGIDETELRNGDRIDWHFVLYNELPCKKIGE